MGALLLLRGVSSVLVALLFLAGVLWIPILTAMTEPFFIDESSLQVWNARAGLEVRRAEIDVHGIESQEEKMLVRRIPAKRGDGLNCLVIVYVVQKGDRLAEARVNYLLEQLRRSSSLSKDIIAIRLMEGNGTDDTRDNQRRLSAWLEWYLWDKPSEYFQSSWFHAGLIREALIFAPSNSSEKLVRLEIDPSKFVFVLYLWKAFCMLMKFPSCTVVGDMGALPNLDLVTVTSKVAERSSIPISFLSESETPTLFRSIKQMIHNNIFPIHAEISTLLETADSILGFLLKMARRSDFVGDVGSYHAPFLR